MFTLLRAREEPGSAGKGVGAGLSVIRGFCCWTEEVKAKERGREADIDRGCAEAAAKILCGGRKVPQGRVSFWRVGFLIIEPIFLLL